MRPVVHLPHTGNKDAKGTPVKCNAFQKAKPASTKCSSCADNLGECCLSKTCGQPDGAEFAKLSVTPSRASASSSWTGGAQEGQLPP